MDGMEWQVSNPELSMRMKELGVKQDSYFSWYNPSYIDGRIREDAWLVGESSRPSKNMISAFTVAELFEITLKDSNVVWKFFKSKNGWMIYSASDEPGYCWPENEMFVAETVADALAKMLIHLIEKGIAKP